MKYIGQGAFRPGIPARDLTAAEVQAHGGAEFLAATGLYEPIRKRKQEVNNGHQDS